MADRAAVFAMIYNLPPGNVDDVYRFVAGMYATAEGRAMCDCCGRWIEDVRGLPRCGAMIDMAGKLIDCANTGHHWKLTQLGARPATDTNEGSQP